MVDESRLLEYLFQHPDVEEIDINGRDRVFATLPGGDQREWDPIAVAADELLELVRRVGARRG